MNRNKKLTIAAAAFSGLLVGATARTMAATVPSSDRTTSARSIAGVQATHLDEPPTTSPTDKHACKGANSCKGNGGCNTGDNGCKGKNSCKGKGGCKTNDDSNPAPAPGKM